MSPLEKRERATGWYQQWIEPTTQALYLRELERARELVEAGRIAIARGELRPPDAAAKAGHLLDYNEYFIAKLAGREAALEQCPQFEAQLNRASNQPAAEALRRRLLFQFRCSAERLGYKPLDPAAFQALYDAVPAEERNDEFWHFASTWAFTHNQAAVLEQAYGEFSVNSGKFMPDWLWWRVRLMHLLMAGETTDEDVRQLLLNVDVEEHLSDFQHTFVPRLRAAGMFTPEFEALLEERREWIAGRSKEDILQELSE